MTCLKHFLKSSKAHSHPNGEREKIEGKKIKCKKNIKILKSLINFFNIFYILFFLSNLSRLVNLKFLFNDIWCAIEKMVAEHPSWEYIAWFLITLVKITSNLV